MITPQVYKEIVFEIDYLLKKKYYKIKWFNGEAFIHASSDVFTDCLLKHIVKLSSEFKFQFAISTNYKKDVFLSIW